MGFLVLVETQPSQGEGESLWADWSERMSRLMRDAPRHPQAAERFLSALRRLGSPRRLFEVLLGDESARAGLESSEASWLRCLALAWRDLGPAPLLARAVSPKAALPWFAPLTKEAQEILAVAFLDSANHCLGVEPIFRGAVASLAASPREILCAALSNGAARILIAHNHPSRDPMPSPEDEAFTLRLAEAAAIVGIDLVDHLIVCEGGLYYSFAEAWGGRIRRRRPPRNGRGKSSFGRSRGGPSPSAGSSEGRRPESRR